VTALARGARGLAFAVVVAAVLATHPASVVAADAEVRTAHLLVRGDVAEAELARYGALAEACWEHWKAYFGAEPKKKDLPLLLDVRRDREGFESALRRAGVDRAAVANAGGYYDPGSKTSYLFLQPHDSSTRLLVLHELTHQLHAKVMLDNDMTRSPLWHKEGIAEWFGFHRRGKAGLEVGVLDGVVIDDRPTLCAERLRAPGADPWAVLAGTAKAVDYTDALMLVSAFLRTKDETVAKAFKRLERDFESGGDPTKKTERAFAGKKERVLAAVHETWDGFRRPWKGVYIAWDEEDSAIIGTDAVGLPAGHVRAAAGEGLHRGQGHVGGTRGRGGGTRPRRQGARRPPRGRGAGGRDGGRAAEGARDVVGPRGRPPARRADPRPRGRPVRGRGPDAAAHPRRGAGARGGRRRSGPHVGGLRRRRRPLGDGGTGPILRRRDRPVSRGPSGAATARPRCRGESERREPVRAGILGVRPPPGRPRLPARLGEGAMTGRTA
jgi:hypothetical protein